LVGYHVQAQYRPQHGDDPEILATPEDVDVLVDRLLGEDFDHTIAALYLVERPLLPAGVPDHEMYLAVDPQLKVGALMFMDETGNWASLGSTEGRTEIHYALMGNDTQFPPYSDIPLDEVRRAGKEFLETGGRRPSCVSWQEID
jgi:hypothetical protein